MTDTRSESRRSFLAGGLVGAAGGIVGAASAGVFGKSGERAAATQSTATSRKQVEWRLASTYPKSLDTIFGTAERVAELVAAMTDGAFRIRCYQAGELVPAMQVMDAVEKGAAEVGQTGGYYYTGKHPALAFETCVPFGLTARQQEAWLRQAGGLELMREVYAEFGIVNFPCGNTGAQMGGWFREQIHTVADLRGLRMRIPGLGGKVMDKLGVSVQMLAAGDIYPSLERGAIDATEWVGPYDDEKLGFYEIAKNYYYPGWWEPGPTLSLLVSKRAWDELPSDYRAIFETAVTTASASMLQRYDAENPRALSRLLQKGVILRPFSTEILDACREASESLLDDDAARNASYRKILEHWRAFAAESRQWFRTNELAYATYAQQR
ncbi:MAG: TRAP transporter substrate-binding protein [Planctomycetota bacterium]|nr:TRAP transporter substrate-binding protein [Planctomycetota bacterium]MDA0933485.1 TRAP transporter substrate-binding protein [Planctomycetota bacterium]MDA1222967.1 TRAP transporter substrate-binding protein [Planctomycetota bacterium]